jgi:DNA-binding CsgD family transcriptional regulator
MERGRPPASFEHLVERRTELDSISRSLASADDGSGGILVLEGAAGIGKSSLLAAAGALGRTLGMEVLEARGGELEREFGFGIVRQLFERRIGDSDRDRLLTGAALLALPAIELSAEPARDPQSVLHGLRWLAENLAVARPLLLLVDDLQWADEPSAVWLAYLARRIRDVPLLVVAALRTSEEANASVPIDAVRAEPTTEVLTPAPLTEAGVRTIASRSGKVDEEFARACHEVTAGNPFLVRELLHAAAADGVPRTAAGAARIRGFAPAAVSQAVMNRLGRLPETMQRVAVAATVLGQHASVGALAALTELDAGEVSLAVDGLVAADILGTGRPIAFAHPIIAAAVLADLPDGARARLHARAARQLADAGTSAELVATHLDVSDPTGDPWVVEILTVAAMQAQARGAPDIAVTHLRRALIEPPGAERRFGTLMMLGSLEVAVQSPAAVTHLKDALATASEVMQRVPAALALAQAHMVTGELGAAQAVLTAARDADGTNSPAEMRMLLDAYLLAAQVNGRTPPLIDARLERIAHELPGATVPERLLLTQLAFCQLTLGRPAAEVLPMIERSLRDGRLDLDLPDPFAATLPAQLFVFVDHLERAERLLADELADARQRGLVSYVGFGSAARGILALRRGDLALAQTSAVDARLVDARTFGFMIAPLAALDVGIAIELDSLAAAKAAVDHAAAASASLAGATVMAYLHHARGLVAMESRDRRAAVVHLQAADAVFGSLGEVSPAVLSWRSDLARAYAGLGESEQALALARQELALARSFGAPRPVAVALRALAAVSPDDRLEHLGEAVEISAAAEGRLEHAYALAEFGAALRRGRMVRDARERLLEALDLADRCGSVRLERIAREELATLGTRPRRAARAGPAALTPSEARLARMAAQGLSNPEIARALFISRATVETHLTRSYSKLGISSRSQLAEALGEPDAWRP